MTVTDEGPGEVLLGSTLDRTHTSLLCLLRDCMEGWLCPLGDSLRRWQWVVNSTQPQWHVSASGWQLETSQTDHSFCWVILAFSLSLIFCPGNHIARHPAMGWKHSTKLKYDLHYYFLRLLAAVHSSNWWISARCLSMLEAVFCALWQETKSPLHHWLLVCYW
jgi:hypothetical protein